MRCTHLVLALLGSFVAMVQSWDIAVSLGGRLEFFNNGSKTDTIHFNSHNLAAITYDEIHNMMLFVDKHVNYDGICGYHLDSMNTKCFIKRNDGNIEDLAFDPPTELLFFTDTKDGSINRISLKNQGSVDNVYGNLLIKLNMNDQTIKNIAVDSCRRYIYWTNTYSFSGMNMERARFDGSEREVIYKDLPVYTFAIDPQTETNYVVKGVDWLRSTFYKNYDLKKKRSEETMVIYDDHELYFYVPKELTVSNGYIYWMNSSERYSKILQIPKKASYSNVYVHKSIIEYYSERPLGISANYRIREQVQGLQNCEALSNLVPKLAATYNSNNIGRTEPKQRTTEACYAAESKLTCVHGLPVCKCISGYTGQRCNISVCEGYCMQGSCSINNKGIPKCRCNVGYVGERCEFNTCNGYCLNYGHCFLNDSRGPVCQCKQNYVGERCEISLCLNYCLEGSCSINDEGHPECRCNPGYSGDRCEVSVCHGYCLNGGECSLNEEDEPVCECVGNHEGSRCESIKNDLTTKCL